MIDNETLQNLKTIFSKENKIILSQALNILIESMNHVDNEEMNGILVALDETFNIKMTKGEINSLILNLHNKIQQVDII